MENNRWFNISAGDTNRPQATNDTRANGNTPPINGGGYWLDDMWQGRTWCDWIGELSCTQFRSILGVTGSGQNFPPFATAVNIPAIQTMLTAFVTNAAYVWSQPLTQQQAYNQLVECCKLTTTTNTGDIPCEDIFANIQVQEGWCEKWRAAQQSGNQLQIQSEITNLANTYNITMPQAQSIFQRCCGDDIRPNRWMCEGGNCYPHPNGQYATEQECIKRCGDPTGRPCPPTDPNSPWNLLGETNFCNSDWCNQYASNSPNHPDCICCDNGTGTGSEIPCKYVTSHGICEQYWGHMNNNDGQAAMQAISTFAYQEGLSSADAYNLVLKCCPDNRTQGDFPCDRVTPDWCNKFNPALAQGQNSPAMQGVVNGFITYATQFGYNLSYSEAYAILLRCCRDNTTIDVSPWCPQYVIAVDNADLTSMQQIITTVASTFSISWQQASQLLYDECICPDNNNRGPCPPSDQNSPFYTNAGEFCPQCSPSGYYYGHPDCRCCDDNSGTGPCEGFQDNGCCGKCDTWNGDPTTNNMGGLPLMGPNHQCSQFCAQYGADCCPNLGAPGGGGGGGTGTTMPTGTPAARLAAPGSNDNPLGMGSLTELPKNFSGNGFTNI